MGRINEETDSINEDECISDSLDNLSSVGDEVSGSESNNSSVKKTNVFSIVGPRAFGNFSKETKFDDLEAAF
jgi:hypothetical protein